MADRMIVLTEEQRNAVEHDTDLMLTACPGSGKTRVVLAKLLKLADGLTGRPQFVGCITYTNAAVDEIESRLRTFGNGAVADKCDISTIHSFCLQMIVRPYRWLIPEIPPSFKIMTRENSLFEQIVRAVEDEAGRTVNAQTFDDYEALRIDVNGQACGNAVGTGIVTPATATHFWSALRHHGYLDFSMILYYAWQILSENPFVGRGIAARFAWLLIDEFQDTTDIQIAILGALHDHLTTRFFMVGDVNQSIMRFAGARPDLAHDFARRIGADQGKSLTANFRCPAGVVDVAEAVIAGHPAMKSAGRARKIVARVECVHVARPSDAITDVFLPALQDAGITLGKAAILAPWWTHLVPIARTLRDYGVPVVGPGARPYRRRRLIASLAEQLGACAEADDYLGLPGVERALFRIIGEIGGNTRFDAFSYTGRRTALGLIYLAQEVARQYPGGVEWLRAMAREVSGRLCAEEWLLPSAKALLIASAENMIDDMRGNNQDLVNLQVSDMGIFANPEHALQLITLHNAKGREFDGVAMVCMNDGHLPHFSSRNQEGYDDARRLFYVGVTRAKKLLIIASDQADRRNRPCIFISEAGLR